MRIGVQPLAATKERVTSIAYDRHRSISAQLLVAVELTGSTLALTSSDFGIAEDGVLAVAVVRASPGSCLPADVGRRLANAK